MRRFVGIAVSSASVLATLGLAVPSGAILSTPDGLEASPNPASPTEAITIANKPGTDAACDAPGVVDVRVIRKTIVDGVTLDIDWNESDVLVWDVEGVVPDAAGAWSTTIDGGILEPDEYIVGARCEVPVSKETSISPQAAPGFFYAEIDLVVQAAVPTTDAAPDTTIAAPTTTVAQSAAINAAAITPRFAG